MTVRTAWHRRCDHYDRHDQHWVQSWSRGHRSHSDDTKRLQLPKRGGLADPRDEIVRRGLIRKEIPICATGAVPLLTLGDLSSQQDGSRIPIPWGLRPR
jgi:hypothetical protein